MKTLFCGRLLICGGWHSFVVSSDAETEVVLLSGGQTVCGDV